MCVCVCVLVCMCRCVFACACVLVLATVFFSSCYNYVALQLQWNVTYKNWFVIVLFVMKNCFFELFVLWWSLWCLLLVADKDSQYKHEKISFDSYNISLCFFTSQKQLDFFFKLSVKIVRFKYMNIIYLMFFFCSLHFALFRSTYKVMMLCNPKFDMIS